MVVGTSPRRRRPVSGSLIRWRGWSARYPQAYAARMRAWWVYWISISVAAVAWIGGLLILGRGEVRSLIWAPIGLLLLILPLIVGGIDLIAYRRTHEEICR